MWIRASHLKELSNQVKRLIAGEQLDIRDHREGVLRILKNDIQTLASIKEEQVAVLQEERDILKNTLSDISHQIKTPLTSLMIMSDLLEDAPPAKQLELISTIQTTLHRTDWLVSALLKMAKLDAKAVTFNLQPLTSADLINEALASLAIILEVKNQQVRLLGSETFRCDKRWTAEALANLIKNASEHSPIGATITLQAGKNPICSYIKVTDEGPGLDRQTLAKLFRRFEGGTSSKGYGIGLPLAQTIMKNQNGDIDVDPGGNGSGATFTLKFYPKK